MKDLLLGIIVIFTAFIFTAYVYAYTLGLSSGEDVVLRHEGIFYFFLAAVGTLFLGIVGGLEIGRYLEKTMNEKKRQTSMPPPP